MAAPSLDRWSLRALPGLVVLAVLGTLLWLVAANPARAATDPELTIRVCIDLPPDCVGAGGVRVVVAVAGEADGPTTTQTNGNGVARVPVPRGATVVVSVPPDQIRGRTAEPSSVRLTAVEDDQTVDVRFVLTDPDPPAVVPVPVIVLNCPDGQPGGRRQCRPAQDVVVIVEYEENGGGQRQRLETDEAGEAIAEVPTGVEAQFTVREQTVRSGYAPDQNPKHRIADPGAEPVRFYNVPTATDPNPGAGQNNQPDRRARRPSATPSANTPAANPDRSTRRRPERTARPFKVVEPSIPMVAAAIVVEGGATVVRSPSILMAVTDPAPIHLPGAVPAVPPAPTIEPSLVVDQRRRGR